MSNEMKALIVLTDGDGSATYKVVEPEVFTWLTARPNFTHCTGYEEVLPDDVIREIETHTPNILIPKSVYITIGSYENDRALAAPGTTFTRVMDLMVYLNRVGLTIGREYVGTVY